MWKLQLMIVCIINMTALQGSLTYKNCGTIPNAKQTRVVNGTESSEFKWPWMAFINLTLIYNADLSCGGSLIGKRHILTAAHCVVDEKLKPVDPGLINVTLGVHNVLKEGERYRVAEIKRHPGHKDSKSPKDDFFYSINDIAVLVLDRDVKLSKYVIPICLPDDHSENSFESWSAVVVGWGHTIFNGFNGKRSDVLREANVTIWRNDKCHEDIKKFIHIDENKICAGGRIDEGRGTCSMDSGGPLMVYDNEKWTEIGIVESGVYCGKCGHPSVFTRVTEYLDWIKDQM